MRFIYLSLIYVLFLGRDASAELRCPEGSSQFERQEGELRYQWCARPSGEKHGVWVILNQFNHVIEVGWMIEGERHGEWRWRRQDGSLKSVGWYEMGEPVGRWTSWSVNGKIVGAIQHHAAERWPLWLDVDGPRDRQPWVVWQRQIPIQKSVWVERIGGIAVVGTRDAGGVGFIDPVEEERAWWVPLEVESVAGAAWDDTHGEVVVALKDGGLLVWDPNNEEDVAPVWVIRSGRDTVRLVGVWDGIAVVWEQVGRLVGVDLASGEVAWKSSDFYGPSTPVGVVREGGFAGGVLAIRGRSLVFLDPVVGRVLWRQSGHRLLVGAGWTDGRAYSTDRRGRTRWWDAHTGDVARPGQFFPESSTQTSGLHDVEVTVDPSGRMVARDQFMEEALKGSIASSSFTVDEHLDLVLDGKRTAFGDEGVRGLGAIVTFQGEDSAGCWWTRQVLEVPEAPVELEHAKKEGQRSVVAPRARLTWDGQYGDWRFGTAWDVEEQWVEVELPYWVWWEPQLLEAWPQHGETDVEDWLDKVLRCEEPAGSFVGTVVGSHVFNTGRMEMSGHIQVVPVRHRVDGVSGCLIELSMGGETLGVWRGLDADGWVDMYLTLHGNESTLDASLGLTLQPWMVEPSIDADLTVDWLERGNSQRQNMSFSGPLWFGLDDGQLTMEGRTDGGAVRRLILEVPDLRSVQEDDWDDDVEGVQWAGQWRLSANIESKSEKWLGFWSGRRCEIDDDSDDPEGATDSSQR